MKNYTAKKARISDELPTLSEFAESLVRIGAQPRVQAVPRPAAPPNTTLIGVYSPARVTQNGLIVDGNVYDSKEFRDLIRTIDGPLLVRVGASKHLVFVRGKKLWICVPRVHPDGHTLH